MFRRNRGFSLLELLIIILIIAILIAVAVPSFFDYKLRAQRTKAKEDIDIFVNAISLFELEEGKSLWDFSREALAAGATVNDTEILNFIVGPYLKKVSADPWGNPYVCDPEVGYIVSRGANGVENANDILENMDIKVFYGADTLTLKDAIYVDVNNDGITQGDKVYVYFTQTISLLELDLPGDAPYDQENGVDSNPGAASTSAGVADATYFTTRDSAGVNVQPMVANDITAIDDYLEDGGNIDHDTRTIVMTLDANGTIDATVESNLKTTGYINLTAAGEAALIACDLDETGADVTAVANGAFGVRVRKE